MKYISKPVVIDAMQYTGNNRNEIIRWLKAGMKTITQPPGYTGLHVQTERGVMAVSPNEYLIKRGPHVEIMGAREFEEQFDKPTLLVLKSRQQAVGKTLSDWFSGRRRESITVKMTNEYFVKPKDRTGP